MGGVRNDKVLVRRKEAYLSRGRVRAKNHFRSDPVEGESRRLSRGLTLETNQEECKVFLRVALGSKRKTQSQTVPGPTHDTRALWASVKMVPRSCG